jgi:hypothetical protein
MWVRLLFQGLWCYADKRGVLADKPKQIKMDVFPADDVDIEAGLCELAERGFIVRYEAAPYQSDRVPDGAPYQSDRVRCILIPAFQKHQSPHPRETENGLPTPDNWEPPASNLLAADEEDASQAVSYNGFLSPNPSVSTSSEPKVRKRRGYDSEFEAFWDRYPRKEPSKAEAFKSWSKALSTTLPGESPPSVEDIMAGIERWRPAWEARGNPALVPHATTWLNQRRWTAPAPAIPVEYVARGSPASTGGPLNVSTQYPQVSPDELAEWRKQNGLA